MVVGHVTSSLVRSPTDLWPLGPPHACATVVNLKVFVNPGACISCYLPIPLSPWTSYQAKFLLPHPEDKLKRVKPRESKQRECRVNHKMSIYNPLEMLMYV